MYQRQSRDSANQAPKIRKNSSVMAFSDMYVENFSPLLLALPIMFAHIGIIRASILMLVIQILQTFCTKLNFESTRL